MATKVLIIGGAGFISQEIARALVKDEFEVFSLSRQTQPKAGNWIQGDLNHLLKHEVIKSTQWDSVILNRAFTAEDVTNALAIPHVKHWILSSTVSVYRYCKHKTPYKEDQALTPPDENWDDIHWKYARGKLEAEKALIASGNSYSILRPTIVFGPNDVAGRTQWYVDRIMKGTPIAVTQNSHRFSLVSPIDAGQAFALVARNRSKGIYNVAADEIFTLQEFVSSLSQALGKPQPPSSNNKEEAGPYFYETDWAIDNQKLKALGWQPMPWKDLARSVRPSEL